MYVSTLDRFGYAEALHMANAFAEMVEQQLTKHVVVQHHPELLALAEAAEEALGALYIAIADTTPF
jgi:hypothetical protein